MLWGTGGWNEGAKGCYKVFKHSTIRWRQEVKKERREERKKRRWYGAVFSLSVSLEQIGIKILSLPLTP